MGKEVIVDELVRDTFIFESQTPAVGLLIGTWNETGEFCVAHMAQTLEEVDPEADVQEETGTTNYTHPHLQSKSFTEIQIPTISHHAKQVIRMLPGGLVVLGLYFVEPVENIFTTKYEAVIKSLLTIVNKSLSRNPHYGAEFGKINEKLVIHYHPTTKKFTVKVIDCQTFKTHAMETSFTRLEWAKLECEYDTFYAMHLEKADLGVPLKRNMKVLLETFQETLSRAKFIVNGKNPTNNEVFEEQMPKLLESGGISDEEDDVQGDHSESTGSGNSSPRHGHGSDSGNESETENPQNRPLNPLHILIDRAPGLIRMTAPGQDSVSHLHLHGKIAVVAFARKGCSTEFIVEMVKQDILRSLASRIEMHCESLIEEEQGTTQIDEGTTKVYHEVPRRVFANLLGSKLLVSDYLFPGEGPKDSVISFRDILSLRLDDETDIIMTKEKPFNLDELRSKGSLEELICKVDPMLTTPIRRNSVMGLVIAITLVIVLMGILIPYTLQIPPD